MEKGRKRRTEEGGDARKEVGTTEKIKKRKCTDGSRDARNGVIDHREESLFISINEEEESRQEKSVLVGVGLEEIARDPLDEGRGYLLMMRRERREGDERVRSKEKEERRITSAGAIRESLERHRLTSTLIDSCLKIQKIDIKKAYGREGRGGGSETDENEREKTQNGRSG